MSDKFSKRREAARKPSLGAVIYKYSKAELNSTQPAAIAEARAVEAEPCSPAAWEKVINQEIKRAV